MDNVQERVIELTTDLVKIYSPYFEEEKVMDFAYNWLKNKNIPVSYHRYKEDKITNFSGINVVGNIKGNKEGPKILLNGHLDTVTISQGWTKNPLKPTIEGDRLYGLGALDMKGGSAAIMIALEAFLRNNKEFKGQIVYTFVSDEEGPYGLGTDATILDGLTEGVDLSIVAEPSSGFADVEFPCLCLGARGGYNYNIRLTGKASHAANPELGQDAILDGAKLICALNDLDLKEDPLLGKGSLVVIQTSGGGAACSLADQADFTIFRHVVRGEDKEYLIREVDKAAQIAGIKSQYQIKFRDVPHEEVDGFKPYIVELDNPYTKTFRDSIKAITGSYGNIAYFSSIGDFNYLGSRIGAPTFIFGASGKNYHSPDEWVSIDSLTKTTQVIYHLLESLLKV